MQKNVLQLQKKYTNVVNLKTARNLPQDRDLLIDLRTEKKLSNREVFAFEFDQKLKSRAREIAFRARVDEIQRKKATRPKQQSYYTLAYKVVSVFLIILLNVTALSQIGSTFSIFNDIEETEDNNFHAGIIDFELTLSPFSNDAWQNLVSGTSTAQDVDVLPDIVSNPFFYYASSTNFIGDPAFCEAIHVIATLDGDTMYDGPLTVLLSTTTTNIAIWNLEFSNDQKFFNSVCQFDIDFNGWQTRHDYPQYHDGFSDTERTTHTLFSDGLKINKVYFEAPKSDCRMDNLDDHFLGEDDPRLDREHRGESRDRQMRWPHPSRDCYDGRGRENSPRTSTSSTSSEQEAQDSATTSLPHHEWVEIYNENDEPADIDGWFLCDGQACDTLNAPEPIPAGGFAIVVGDLSHLNGWITPSDFVIIVVEDGQIGDGLDNENDGLSLLRPDFFAFDRVNWGIPDVTWPYYSSEFWNPGVASTTDGSMIARVPTGFDTNQVTDWTVLYIPTMNLLYPGDVVNHPWYWGYIYLVTWEATNPNGPDSDLLIDIWLIQDTNYNGYIDGGDNHILMVSKTENDGMEEITVPEGFIGDIWIKVIATGPENPMAHGFDISGAIYDPVPTHMLDDEDDQELIESAVRNQMLAQGVSEYDYMIAEEVQDELEEAYASSTASTTEEVASSTASTTEPVASTTPETLPEETSTSTEDVIEEEERHDHREPQERRDESPSNSSEQATTTEDTIIEEEDIDPSTSSGQENEE